MIFNFLLLSSLVLAQETRYAEAILYPDRFNGKGDGMYGRVVMTQGQYEETVRLDIYVEGLEPNSLHGMHIHSVGIENGNCSTALLHWNPDNVSHGSLDSYQHHPGDFSNIQVESDGNKLTVIKTNAFSLWGEGEKSPFNRGIVLHESKDDLGLAGDEGSRTTGNSGARLICGNIAQKYEDPDGGSTDSYYTYSPVPSGTYATGIPTDINSLPSATSLPTTSSSKRSSITLIFSLTMLIFLL